MQTSNCKGTILLVSLLLFTIPAAPQGARAFAAKLLTGARPTPDNAYKLALAERTIGAALADARS